MCSLFGDTPPVVNLAPPLSAYPSEDDAAFARSAGGFYGQPMDGYPKHQFQALQGDAVDMGLAAATDPSMARRTTEGDPAIGDVLARAALAANRVPVAALGFDPRRINVAQTGGDKYNIAGAYSPQYDNIFAALGSSNDASNVSTPVHESVHRGLEMLKAENPKLFDGAPGDGEQMVRFIMGTMAGDPENDPEADKERRRRELGTHSFRVPATKWAEGVNRAASDKIYRNKPFGGPR